MAKKPGNPGFFHPEIIKSAAKLLKMSMTIAAAAWLAIFSTPPGERLATIPMSEMRTFVDSDRALDIDITDPEALRSWFAEKVDFAPPRLPAAGAMTLVGGRLCYFLDRRVIAYMYRVEGLYHSLYVMKDEGLEAIESRRE